MRATVAGQVADSKPRPAKQWLRDPHISDNDSSLISSGIDGPEPRAADPPDRLGKYGFTSFYINVACRRLGRSHVVVGFVKHIRSWFRWVYRFGFGKRIDIMIRGAGDSLDY